MSGFVTIDNIHEATDVSRIRRLMANAERLGEVELVKQCSDRLKILTASKKIKKAEHDPLDIIPDIDYQYWASQHTFYGDKPFQNNDTVRKGLNHAEKGGLIKSKDYSNPMQILSKIEQEIKKIDINTASTDELLLIFDLIQGWGGVNCRQTYISIRGVAPGRISDPKAFSQNYVKILNLLKVCGSMDQLKQSMVTELVDAVENLDRLSLNFGSKHLFFWSKFWGLNTIFYIYDTRMKAIAKLFSGKNVSYFNYLGFLRNVEKHLSLSEGTAERGIFAFSNNFFTNTNPPKLKSVDKIMDNYQIELAKTFVR